MENLTAYLTKEGWSKDWNKTKSDISSTIHSKYFPGGISILTTSGSLLVVKTYLNWNNNFTNTINSLATTVGIIYLTLALFDKSSQNKDRSSQNKENSFLYETTLNDSFYRVRGKKHVVLVDVSIAKVLKSGDYKIWRPKLLNPFKIVTEEKEIELRLLASMINPNLSLETFIGKVTEKLYGDVFEEIKSNIADLLFPLYCHYNLQRA